MRELDEAIDNEDNAEDGGETGTLEAKPRKSMRKAINEYCKSCTYDDCAPGNWRQQVTDCTVTKCALWELRPMSKPRKVKEDI